MPTTAIKKQMIRRLKTWYRAKECLDRFIVLEGLDGAGKSTQAQLLAGAINNAGAKVSLTGEPTTNNIGTLIQHSIDARRTGQYVQYYRDSLAMLYAADRLDHLYNPDYGMVPALQRGEWVICSRYFFSSFVYQYPQHPLSEIMRCNRLFPSPRYLFYFALPASHAVERLQNMDAHDIFEHQEVLHRKEQLYYSVLQMVAGSQTVLHTIDASRSIQDTAQSIWSVIKSTATPPKE